MSLPRLIAIAALIGACSPPSKSLEGDGSESNDDGGDGSPGSSESGQGSFTGQGPGGSDTETLSGTGSSSLSQGGSGTAGTISATGGMTMTSGAPGSTGAELCDLDQIVCDTAELGKTPPDDIIDCGHVTLMDSVADWEAASACALAASSSGEGFKAVFELMGIDSDPSDAFVGLVGAVYQNLNFFHDEGGFVAGAVTQRRDCLGLIFLTDCIVGPGNHCILCLNPSASSTVCES